MVNLARRKSSAALGTENHTHHEDSGSAPKESPKDRNPQASSFETELSGIVGHVVDYSFLFLQYESISLSEHLTLTAVGTLPVTADIFY